MVKLADPPAKLDKSSTASVVWAALEKIAAKQKLPDEIVDGSRHSVQLKIEAEVDGEPFQSQLQSMLSVGHTLSRSSSVNPQVPELIAWILSKLNRATRNRILADLPDEFAAGGNSIPVTSEVLVSEVEHMLRQLRQTKNIQTRGPIRCEYSLQAIE